MGKLCSFYKLGASDLFSISAFSYIEPKPRSTVQVIIIHVLWTILDLKIGLCHLAYRQRHAKSEKSPPPRIQTSPELAALRCVAAQG